VTVCLDTNVVLQMFGQHAAGRKFVNAFAYGQITVAVSTPIWLEYEEVAVRMGGGMFWSRIERLFLQVEALHGNVLFVKPKFHFHVVAHDPDDDAFADCAITAGADYIVTADRHFDALVGSGYKPQPITLDDFVSRHLP
jgi:putative PIN family toxin of toxin-antitoxin system